MKIFISHKQEDNAYALGVKQVLDNCKVKAYLDVLDNEISENGDELTEHIKSKLRECTDVIVILSEKTRESWWVPFEIGMASEKDIPIANYLISGIKLPEYLEFWPRLKNQNDVLKYVTVRKKVSESRREKFIYESSSLYSAESETKEFYRKLKQELR
jgi:hypothetical protein